MKTVKVVTLEATFAELPAARAYQQGRGTGSSLKVAASRAIQDLCKKLKGRRITAGKITMSVGTRLEEPKEQEILAK